MSEPYPESRSTRWISASTSVQQPTLRVAPPNSNKDQIH